MELSEFNSHFLSDLLEKVSFENKAIVLFGDFNANLLQYNRLEQTNYLLILAKQK